MPPRRRPPPARPPRSTASARRRSWWNWPRLGRRSGYWRSGAACPASGPSGGLRITKPPPPIWERIQALAEPAPPPAQPAKPKAARHAKGGAQAAKGAPVKGKAAHKGHPRQEGAPGQKGCRGGACRHRSAPGQQDGPGGRYAATQERRHPGGDHADHGMAEAHGTRLHGRRDEEGRARCRVLQARWGRTYLSTKLASAARPSVQIREYTSRK
jgi:hypothetical protein